MNEELIRDTYLTRNKVKTLKHVEEVAETAAWLAGIHHLDVQKARTAALLHDISAVMSPLEMYETAVERGMPIDPAEEKYHFLLHQRISRIIAEEQFGIRDEDILSAVECHTTLKQNAGPYDQLVFIADKISWDQEGVPPYQFENKLLLMPHRWISEAYEELKKKRE